MENVRPRNTWTYEYETLYYMFSMRGTRLQNTPDIVFLAFNSAEG